MTQPGRVIARFQVKYSWTGMPRVSLLSWVPPRAQSAESQMTRPADITTRCSWAGLRSKVQVPGAVETALTPNCGFWPDR